MQKLRKPTDGAKGGALKKMQNRRKPTDGVQRYVEGDFRREKQKYNYL